YEEDQQVKPIKFSLSFKRHGKKKDDWDFQSAMVLADPTTPLSKLIQEFYDQLLNNLASRKSRDQTTISECNLAHGKDKIESIIQAPIETALDLWMLLGSKDKTPITLVWQPPVDENNLTVQATSSTTTAKRRMPTTACPTKRRAGNFKTASKGLLEFKITTSKIEIDIHLKSIVGDGGTRQAVTANVRGTNERFVAKFYINPADNTTENLKNDMIILKFVTRYWKEFQDAVNAVKKGGILPSFVEKINRIEFVEGFLVELEKGSFEYLSDPQINSRTCEYGMNDLGMKGIQTFIKTHECNSICHGLGLRPFNIACD
ncbi:hypothetical protein HDU76_008705, partial [Blyttiomyces sp. JEL0837]